MRKSEDDFSKFIVKTRKNERTWKANSDINHIFDVGKGNTDELPNFQKQDQKPLRE